MLEDTSHEIVVNWWKLIKDKCLKLLRSYINELRIVFKHEKPLYTKVIEIYEKKCWPTDLLQRTKWITENTISLTKLKE
jgi:hypothetical protein